MAYKPRHLKRFREQINYTGDNFDSYFIAAWRFFRCSPVERSNFRYIKEHLQDCGSEGVIFPRFTDAVMMCRYYVMVHEDCDRGLRMADMFAERVKRKGSLDTDTEQHLGWDAVLHSWRSKTLPKRVELCQEAGVTVFAARRQTPTHEALIELLAEGGT